MISFFITRVVKPCVRNVLVINVSISFKRIFGKTMKITLFRNNFFSVAEPPPGKNIFCKNSVRIFKSSVKMLLKTDDIVSA
jgi:ABC-type phosphate transport system permease subunit